MSARAIESFEEDVGGAVGPLSTAAGLVGRSAILEEIAGRLLCAEEELQAALRACLEVDEKFSHEVAQMVFAAGAVRLSWRKKHGI